MSAESNVEWSELLESGFEHTKEGSSITSTQQWPLEYLCSLAAIQPESNLEDEPNIPSLLTKQNQQCNVRY